MVGVESKWMINNSQIIRSHQHDSFSDFVEAVWRRRLIFWHSWTLMWQPHINSSSK